MPNHRNGPDPCIAFERIAPQQVGNLDIQSMHEPIRGVCRQCTYVLQDIMHMGLRDAAHARQPAFRDLAGVHSLAREIDQFDVQFDKIHKLPLSYISGRNTYVRYITFYSIG